MVSSKPEQDHWYVMVKMSFERQQYEVGNIMPQRGPLEDPDRLGPYLLVEAQDEIGAFSTASKILARLNLHPAP